MNEITPSATTVVEREDTQAPAPSGPTGTEVTTTPARSGRRGLRIGALALAGVLLLVAGFGLGRITADEAKGTAGPSTTVGSTTASTTPPGGDEPVAAVAAALLPATVQIETDSGLGSGFIYDSGGYILTAGHVVDGSGSVIVRLSDGTRVDGTVIGVDRSTDVAVVEIDHGGLQAAELALGVPLQVGQMAVAIGSPFGLDNTVTAGVVSSIGQPLQASTGAVQAMIQTDTPINPGSSGGPLANRDAQVIGINDAIFSRSGGNEGIGFAIPIDTAKQIADKLVADEPITRPILGVTGTDPAMGSSGALITGVVPDSAADRAGFEVGDLVVEAGGRPVTSFTDLAVVIGAHQPGDEVAFDLIRGGRPVEITATLGESTE